MTQNKRLQPVTGRHQEEGRRAWHKLKRQDREKKQLTEDIWSTDQVYSSNTSTQKEKEGTGQCKPTYRWYTKLINAMLGKILGINDR